MVLLLTAFLANTCVHILRHYGYVYTISSFGESPPFHIASDNRISTRINYHFLNFTESIAGYTFLRLANQPAPMGYSSTTPERFMSHASFLLGQRVTRSGANISAESGYQVLRLATELVPATLALLGTEQLSPFWAILFYFVLISFGIAQQVNIVFRN